MVCTSPVSLNFLKQGTHCFLLPTTMTPPPFNISNMLLSFMPRERLFLLSDSLLAPFFYYYKVGPYKIRSGNTLHFSFKYVTLILYLVYDISYVISVRHSVIANTYQERDTTTSYNFKTLQIIKYSLFQRCQNGEKMHVRNN